MSPVEAVADTSCPECRAAKHPNCDGGSWDTDSDRAAACPCWANGHGVDTWRVEARSSGYVQPWAPYVDRLSQQTALDTAAWLQTRYAMWQLRLVDDATGEVVHLGRDGKPMPVVVTRIDRRTPEQLEADKAADRYEASLEVRR